MSDSLFFPSIVCDFDGTIRHPPDGKDFINHPEHVRMYPGVFEKLWHHRNNGHVILGLTNQGGVAFGHKTPDDFLREVRRMRQIGEERGQRWPFHEWYGVFLMEGGSVGPYSARSLCRKPRYGGLAVLARRLWENHSLRVDWDRSIMVGDSEDDFGCAKNAEIGFLQAEHFRESDPKVHRSLAVDPTQVESFEDLPRTEQPKEA